MKKIAFFVSILTLVLYTISCSGQGNQKVTAQTANSSKVIVYYFHFSHRCSTCLAVEANARKAVEELYADKIKSGEYSFAAINLDDAKSKDIADKLGVGGQTLLVVRGNKKIDITDKGFMNANDFDKMKEEIKSAVEEALL
jgi:hypothetical protein